MKRDTVIILIIAGISSIFFFFQPDQTALNAYWGIIARNYVRYGLCGTKFAMIDNAGLTDPAAFHYYTHHPPLSSIITAGFLKILGVHLWSIRLPYFLCGIGTNILLYKIALSVWNRRVAVIAAILALGMPFYASFGGTADLMTFGIFFSLLAVFFYHRWLVTKTPGAAIAFSAALLLGLFSSWESYYYALAILIHNLIWKKERLTHIIIIATALFGISIYIIHIILITGLTGPQSLTENIRWAVVRKYLNGFTGYSQFTSFPLNCIYQTLHWAWLMFSPLVVSCAALFLIKRQEENPENRGFITLFLIAGSLGYILFGNLYFIHPNRLYGLLPALLFMAALFLNRVYGAVKKYFSPGFPAVAGVGLMVFFLLQAHVPAFQRFQSEFIQKNCDPFCLAPGTLNSEKTSLEISGYLAGKINPRDVYLTNLHSAVVRFYSARDCRYVTDKSGLERTIRELSRGQNELLFFFYNSNPATAETKDELLDYLTSRYPLLISFEEGKYLIFDLSGAIKRWKRIRKGLAPLQTVVPPA